MREMLAFSSPSARDSSPLRDRATGAWEIRHDSDAFRRKYVTKTKFDRLVSAWIDDSRLTSSVSEIKSHPNFSQLVDMGDDALRLVLYRLKDGDVRVLWFPLMKAIASEDPVVPEHRGILQEMARDWLLWGQQNGKL